MVCVDVTTVMMWLLLKLATCSTHHEVLTVKSSMQGGVPKKHWDGLRREVLHTYGHEHILTLTSLQDAGKTFVLTV